MNKKPPGQDSRSPVAFLIGLIKLGSLLLLPWVYWAYDQTDLAEMRLTGFNPYQAVWMAPLFHVNGIIGSLLYHAGTPWIVGSLRAPVGEIVGVGVLFHLYFPLRLLSGATGVFSAIDGVLLGGVVIGSLVIGTRLDRRLGGERLRRLTEQGGDRGQYVIPLQRTGESEGIDSTEITMNKRQSVLVLGTPGVGKTESIRLLSKQLDSDSEEPFIAFDYKSEYREMFDEDDQIILSLTDSTHYWNVFDEVEEEREFKSIGQRLFPKEEAEEAGQNAFFIRGARQVFVATLRYIYRNDNHPSPTNAHVATLFKKCDYKQLYAKLEEEGLGGSVKSYIDPGAAEQALGVYSFLLQKVEDVFVDDFARQGDFSIREYMQDPQGRKLILDMPQTSSDAVAPAFRFFIDRAIQYALADGSRGSYFILDEFARVPHLQRIEDLTGAGRAQKAQGILGLQGISQLQSNYEENYAQDILATVPQEILMRPGDAESTEYILNRIGESQYTVRREKPEKFGEVEVFNKTQNSIEEVHALSEAEIQRFDKGEAILMTEKGWIRGQLPLWDDLPEAIRRGLAGRPARKRSSDDGNERDEGTGLGTRIGERVRGVLGRTNGSDVTTNPGDGAPQQFGSNTESTTTGQSAGRSQRKVVGDQSEANGGKAVVDADSGRTINYCPHCAHDLSGLGEPDFCPECGNSVEA